MLTWRPYRDRDKAPVPVLKAVGPPRVYAFDPASSERTESVPAPLHTQWRAPVSGQAESWPGEPARDTVEYELLSDEPVLVNTVESGWKLAKALGVKPGLVAPKEGGEEPSLICPGQRQRERAQSAKGPAREIRESGVYRTYRGYVDGPKRVLVNGEPWQHFDYDPYHGALAVFSEDSGALEPEAFVEVEFAEGPSSLLPLRGIANGRYLLSRSSAGSTTLSKDERGFGYETIGRLEVSSPEEFTDTRRRSEPLSSSRAGVVGRGHMDAGPLSERHLWVIETNADPSEVRRAARRTLPAGSLLRIVPHIIRAPHSS